MGILDGILGHDDDNKTEGAPATDAPAADPAATPADSAPAADGGDDAAPAADPAAPAPAEGEETPAA